MNDNLNYLQNYYETLKFNFFKDEAFYKLNYLCSFLDIFFNA